MTRDRTGGATAGGTTVGAGHHAFPVETIMSFGSVPRFYIQTSCPSVRQCARVSVYDLQDAITTIFDAATEDAFIVWDATYIPLQYKYDVSDFIEQFLDMIAALLLKETGTRSETFASNDFLATWHLSWSDDLLEIDAKWSRSGGDCESIARRCSQLAVTRSGFLAEWKWFLRILYRSILESQIRIENKDQLAQLLSLESAIEKYGFLYSQRRPD